MDDGARTDGTLTEQSGQNHNHDNGFPLELHEITKQFGGVTALEQVSFKVKRGSIHALLGENGAGKTTLMRIAFGMVTPDAGWIATDGQRKHISSPADAIACGIGMVHQQFSLVSAMTVAENIALGGKGRYSLRAVTRLLADIAARTGLELDPMEHVANLGSADRQKLEIVRTLAHDARVIILDEPTAVLTPGDISELFSQIQSFAERGGSVVLITHKLRDALEHADEVTVLRHGHIVMTSAMSATDRHSLATAMLGTAPVRETRGRLSATLSAPVARLEGVVLAEERYTAGRPAIDLELRGGEIVGIAALEGAARPLLRTLAGRSKAISGTALIPSDVGFVPENRREEALISGFSLTQNLALSIAGEGRGLLNWRGLERETAAVMKDFDVRATGIEATPDKLSGGNQQRFVLGRELRNDPPLLVLENPTQGLDLAATVFVHDRMRLARSKGIAIVFYSSDLDELAELSDRVLIVSGSGIVETIPDRNEIGSILLGANNSATISG